MKPYFAFQWHITDYCDQRCKHCYIFSEGKCSELLSMSLDMLLMMQVRLLKICSLRHIPLVWVDVI